MARMTSRPRIGALIRDAMYRKRMDQIKLAEAVGASRSAVNAWINDRAWPDGWRIVALEDVLDIKIPRASGHEDAPGEDTDPQEQELRATLERLRESSLIEADDVARLLERYRRRRNGSVGENRPGIAS